MMDRIRRQKTEKLLVPVTMHGKTHHVPKDMPLPAPPRIPADWEQRALSAALIVTGVLTVASVVWSTVSIGNLLHGGVGYAAATVFDASWIVVLLMEFLGRYDRKRRKTARILGWLLLVFTMGAIAGDGIARGDIGLAICGAAVSLVAKLLWLGVLGHIHHDLSPDAAGWVAAEQNAAAAELAVAGIDRRVARSRAKATAHRLAIEHLYGPQATHEVQRAESAPVIDVEPDEDILTRAVADQLRARAIVATEGYGPAWHEVSAQADESMQEAMDAGFPARQVLEQVERYRPSAPRRNVPESPEAPVSVLVNAAEPVGAFRPEPDEGPEPEHARSEPEEGERVPEQRPANLRAGVHALYGLGMTAPDEITRHLASVLGSKPNAASIDRYLREAKKAASKGPDLPSDGDGTGFYR
ncbi:hypothetical protein QMK19_39340 [Streptomyces sp. H10-C2]|uniref:hypothetical protein n=1 Tax=Streptomyces sp. H10-C2 TaxID=3046210 RepID=UPI0024B931BE|nr:hypothetical protein [Streptomyces sp. H10-C2]MDJ0375484.1 hypothetical protein [Streptomyces sp. H10-C2]